MSNSTRRPPPSRLAALRRDRPECAPWLALYEVATQVAADPVCEAALASSEIDGHDGRPLLAGVTLTVPASTVARQLRLLTDRLWRVSGARVFVSRHAEGRCVEFLEAALGGDAERVETLAAVLRLDLRVGVVLASFLAMPFLLVSGRLLGPRVSPDWRGGYCPVCGAWPTLAESRGLEGARRFRCGRCGGDWHADWLTCPFCDNRDHTELGALVPEEASTTQKAETCKRCLGYVKTITTLMPCPPAEIPLVDLETVPLDVAALSEGYQRPGGLAVPLPVRVAGASGPERGLLSWLR